jgi:hypothetical protein
MAKMVLLCAQPGFLENMKGILGREIDALSATQTALISGSPEDMRTAESLSNDVSGEIKGVLREFEDNLMKATAKTVLARLVKPDMRLRFGKHDRDGFLVGTVEFDHDQVRLAEKNTAELRTVPVNRRLSLF